MRCCGAHSWADWTTSHWYNTSLHRQPTAPAAAHSPTRRQRRHYRVPDTCCFERVADDDAVTSALGRQMSPVCVSVRLTPALNVITATPVLPLPAFTSS